MNKNTVTYELYDNQQTIRLMGENLGEWIESDVTIPQGDWQ